LDPVGGPIFHGLRLGVPGDMMDCSEGVRRYRQKKAQGIT
jgi:hypothetical protein